MLQSAFSEDSYIVNLYRGMVKLKLKINENLLQLLCVVISVALHGEFERFGVFWVDCYYTLLYVIRRRQGWKAHFQPL